MQIKSSILAHFSKLYTSEAILIPIVAITPRNFQPIPLHILQAISREVTSCEIKKAIFSFQPQKVPGPDGFHPIFFQRFWNIVGHSITSRIKDIFLTRKILFDLSTTLIQLIPKVGKPETILQYRLIDLCNTIYKTITKVLVYRLKPHLNNIIIAQELKHTMSISKSKQGLMALKIDLEKAFDRLEWGFIKHIISFFNFPIDQVELIMSCISTLAFQSQ